MTRNALVGSTTVGSSTGTGDVSYSMVAVPQPTLTLAFGGATRVPFTFPRPMPAARSAAPPTRAPLPASSGGTAPEADEHSTDDASATKAPETPADSGVPAASNDARAERIAAAVIGKPPADTAAAAQHDEKRPVPVTAPIELIIDSLTGYSLIEPIPVVIESLGDMVFTACVSNLNIQATGNSIGEALLILKEQIEATYDELTKRPPRDAEQKATLQMLQTYIAPSIAPKAKRWF